MDLWERIAGEAEAESGLWAEMVLPPGMREREAVFSTLGAPVHALGLETIYEGYLMHYGRPRLFAGGSRDRALLLGDYLYAHGLVQLAGLGQVAVVSDLAALISLCARMRADGAEDDGPLWAATAALLGDRDGLSVARETLRIAGDSAPLLALARLQAGEEAVAEALAAHQNRLG
ncbi:MAG: hypothetical protein ACXVZP_06245 [Gaiellaceae bacterium]